MPRQFAALNEVSPMPSPINMLLDWAIEVQPFVALCCYLLPMPLERGS